MNLTGAQRTEVESQIARLAGDGRDAAAFIAGIHRNIRSWEERLASPAEAKAARWLLLDALLARISVTEDPREIFHVERMAFARDYCQRLLREDGDAYAGGDHIRLRVVTQLLGGERAKTCRHAWMEAAAP